MKTTGVLTQHTPQDLLVEFGVSAMKKVLIPAYKKALSSYITDIKILEQASKDIKLSRKNISIVLSSGEKLDSATQRDIKNFLAQLKMRAKIKSFLYLKEFLDKKIKRIISSGGKIPTLADLEYDATNDVSSLLDQSDSFFDDMNVMISHFSQKELANLIEQEISSRYEHIVSLMEGYKQLPHIQDVDFKIDKNKSIIWDIRSKAYFEGRPDINHKEEKLIKMKRLQNSQLEEQKTTLLTSSRELALVYRSEQLKNYKQQRKKGFVMLPSRQKIMDEIYEEVVDGNSVLISGHTGTGKTVLAVKVSQSLQERYFSNFVVTEALLNELRTDSDQLKLFAQFTGKSEDFLLQKLGLDSSIITQDHKLILGDLLKHVNIKKMLSTKNNLSIQKAVRFKPDLVHVLSGNSGLNVGDIIAKLGLDGKKTITNLGKLLKAFQEGKIPIFDEINLTPNDVLMRTKHMYTLKAGNTYSPQEGQGEEIDIRTNAVIATANLGEKYAEAREALDAAMIRLFSGIEATYFSKDETYDLGLIALMDDEGFIAGVDKSDLEANNSLYLKLIEALKHIEENFSGKGSEICINGQRDFWLKKAVMDVGNFLKLIKNYGMDDEAFDEYLQKQLIKFVTNTQYSIEDRKILLTIFNQKKLIGKQHIPLILERNSDFTQEVLGECLIIDITKSTKSKQATVNFIDPYEVALMDPYDVRNIADLPSSNQQIKFKDFFDTTMPGILEKYIDHHLHGRLETQVTSLYDLLGEDTDWEPTFQQKKDLISTILKLLRHDKQFSYDTFDSMPKDIKQCLDVLKGIKRFDSADFDIATIYTDIKRVWDKQLTLYKESQQLWTQGKLNESIDLLYEALSLDSDSLVFQGEIDKRLAEKGKIIENILKQGLEYLQNNDFVGASKKAEEVLVLDPKNKGANDILKSLPAAEKNLETLVQESLNKKDFTTAKETIKVLEKLNPQNTLVQKFGGKIDDMEYDSLLGGMTDKVKELEPLRTSSGFYYHDVPALLSDMIFRSSPLLSDTTKQLLGKNLLQQSKNITIKEISINKLSFYVVSGIADVASYTDNTVYNNFGDIGKKSGCETKLLVEELSSDTGFRAIATYDGKLLLIPQQNLYNLERIEIAKSSQQQLDTVYQQETALLEKILPSLANIILGFGPDEGKQKLSELLKEAPLRSKPLVEEYEKNKNIYSEKQHEYETKISSLAETCIQTTTMLLENNSYEQVFSVIDTFFQDNNIQEDWTNIVPASLMSKILDISKQSFKGLYGQCESDMKQKIQEKEIHTMLHKIRSDKLSISAISFLYTKACQPVPILISTIQETISLHAKMSHTPNDIVDVITHSVKKTGSIDLTQSDNFNTLQNAIKKSVDDHIDRYNNTICAAIVDGTWSTLSVGDIQKDLEVFDQFVANIGSNTEMIVSQTAKETRERLGLLLGLAFERNQYSKVMHDTTLESAKLFKRWDDEMVEVPVASGIVSRLITMGKSSCGLVSDSKTISTIKKQKFIKNNHLLLSQSKDIALEQTENTSRTFKNYIFVELLDGSLLLLPTNMAKLLQEYHNKAYDQRFLGLSQDQKEKLKDKGFFGKLFN